MNGFVTFIQTVGAQVLAYYLCKWRDSLIGKGSKHYKEPLGSASTGGLCFLRGIHVQASSHCLALLYAATRKSQEKQGGFLRRISPQ